MRKREREFLEFIAENPGDNTLRLVYADWLDEQGDLRGQLIRLVVEMESVSDRLKTEFAEDLQQLAVWKYLLGVKTGPLGTHPIEVVSDDGRPAGFRLRAVRTQPNAMATMATAIRLGFARGAIPALVVDPPPAQ